MSAEPASRSRRVGRWEGAILLALVGLYLALGALYATRVPPYNAPDEPAHFNYVRDLGERLDLPVLQPGDWDTDLLERLKSSHFPPGSDVSTIRYESHQPPLYYLLVAPVARLTASLGERRELVAVRLATLVFGALALLTLHRVATFAFPEDPTTRLVAVGFAGLIPMHLAIAGSVSNDAAAELLLALLLWRCLEALRAGLDAPRAALIGLLVGVGMLTKLSDYAGIPLAGVAILGAAPRSGDSRPRLGQAFRHVLVAGAVALVIAGPWLIRGALVYGPDDPFGLRRHDQVVAGQPLTGALSAAAIARDLTTLFHSFWGQFGWMGVLLDERIYVALGLLSGLVGVGTLLWLAPWGGFWHELAPLERRAAALCALLVLGVALGTVGYNLMYSQPQGRYLFPAMAGIAVWTAGGLREVFAPRQRVALYGLLGLGLATLDLVALIRFVEPALQP